MKKSEITYHEPEGIIAYVKELNRGKTVIHEPVYFKKEIDKIEVEVAFQFVDAFEENILGFCNNIFTQEGGTHLVGLRPVLPAAHQFLCKRAWYFKGEGPEFYRSDATRNGMTAIVAVKHPDPIFEGQTKTKLASADATKAVFTISGDLLQHYLTGILRP